MARISLDPPNTLFTRLARAYSRRRYGTDIDPGLAMGHNPRVLGSYAIFETLVERWHSLDPRLGHLAVMAVAHRLGCSWCTDFGFWQSYAAGVPAEVLRQVPDWRRSSAFSDTERAVLAYAEAICGEEDEVSEEMVADLAHRLGKPALVELTMLAALENLRSRFNRSLGLTRQGFTDRCPVPGTAQ
ncbi:carboxymuconolactone decarboxylase family protein [Naumannella sp. ID2617S]|nr:carboxymuconolactone decarboxylase family protein [Naumannella sp. ID2617S]